jgi:hypothetical protein
LTLFKGDGSKPAVLQASVEAYPNTTICLSWEYSGFSGYRHPLKLVRVRTFEDRKTIYTLWSCDSFAHRKWRKAQVQLRFPEQQILQFYSFQHSVDLRNILASHGPCDMPLHSFEGDRKVDPLILITGKSQFYRQKALEADDRLPDVDNTLKTTSGHYLTTTRSEPTNEPAVFQLKPIVNLFPASTSENLRIDCLQFHLFQSNRNSEYVEVNAIYQRRKKNGDNLSHVVPLYTSKSAIFSQIVTWNTVRVNVSAIDYSTIEFKAFRRNDASLPIAIDDIQVLTGVCDQHPLDCAFDVHTCNFQAVQMDVEFKVGTPKLKNSQLLSTAIPSSFLGQSMLYADFTEFELDLLPSDSVQHSGGWKVSLLQAPKNHGFHGVSANLQLLILAAPESKFEFSIHLLNDDNAFPLQLISHDQPTNDWLTIEISFVSQSSWQLMIEASLETYEHRPFIAVRKLLFSPLETNKLTFQESIDDDAISCDFLTDFCGWRSIGLEPFMLAAYSHDRLPFNDLFHGQFKLLLFFRRRFIIKLIF